MNKSYRSTYEIMEFAKKICNQPSLEMVERHGEQPKSIYCENIDSEIAAIADLIKKFEEGGNASLGIVVKTEADAKRLYDLLSEEHQVHLLSQDSTRFTNGVSITTIAWRKVWNLMRSLYLMQITEIMIRIMTGICSILPAQELCIN